MSDDKLLDDINRASRAAQIVDSDLFKEATATIERDLIAAWKLTAVRDTEARERLWQGVLMVGKMEEFFRSAVDNGKLAQGRLNELTREKPTWAAVK
jgi:hypothetical protein